MKPLNAKTKALDGQFLDIVGPKLALILFLLHTLISSSTWAGSPVDLLSERELEPCHLKLANESILIREFQARSKRIRTALDQEDESFREVLTEFQAQERALADQQTVFFSHFDLNGRLVLKKSAEAKWGSSINLDQRGSTPQGDPRVPMVLMGPDLSAAMGWDIQLKDNMVYITVPSDEHIDNKWRLINNYLAARGKKKNLYRPVAGGFLNAGEILDLAIKPGDNILFKFVYAKYLAYLVPHEVFAHLGLILPTEALEKTNLINRRVADLARYIEMRTANQKELFAPYLTALKARREGQLDAGSGNITIDLGLIRMIQGQTSYQQILEKFNSGEIEKWRRVSLGSHMVTLFQPGRSATAVASEMALQTTSFLNATKEDSSRILETLRPILEEFKAANLPLDPAEDSNLESAEKFVDYYLAMLDEWLNDMLKGALANLRSSP